jgi:hypothetical protein
VLIFSLRLHFFTIRNNIKEISAKKVFPKSVYRATLTDMTAAAAAAAAAAAVEVRYPLIFCLNKSTLEGSLDGSGNS